MSLGKRSGKIAGVGLAVLALSMPLQAGQEVDRSFDVNYGGNLLLDTERGSVEIRTWDKAVVEIKVKNPKDLEWSFEQRGDDVYIKAEDNRPAWKLIGWPKKSAVFQINVPHEYNVQIETAGGHITVEDLDGTVYSRTDGGHLKFEQIAGAIDAQTSGGHIALTQCVGQVEVATGLMKIAFKTPLRTDPVFVPRSQDPVFNRLMAPEQKPDQRQGQHFHHPRLRPPAGT